MKERGIAKKNGDPLGFGELFQLQDFQCFVLNSVETLFESTPIKP